MCLKAVLIWFFSDHFFFFLISIENNKEKQNEKYKMAQHRQKNRVDFNFSKFSEPICLHEAVFAQSEWSISIVC